MNRKPLVEDASFVKTIAVMIFCHLSVTFLCINVIFDLFTMGIPLYLLHTIGFISSKTFYQVSSIIINWTTPVVYGIPMVLSGTKVYIDDIDIMIESKDSDSLLLANHGSRIDWMVGMFIAHQKELDKRPSKQCRVGFVCEALIQLMPFIGWYRKIICDDIFVWRSFEKDAPTIKKNITLFHTNEEQRMLFLSPEGVVVDHSDRDMEYVQQCRNFCKTNGYKPFEYVLTPRYKGTACLLDQVSSGGPFVSGCLAFIRDGKLLNCKLLSSKRVIPDIYDLNQGIAGKPISIFVHIRKLHLQAGDKFDAKTRLMEEYKWKDSILAEWDERLKKDVPIEDYTSKYTEVERNCKDVAISHLLRVVILAGLHVIFGGVLDHFIKAFFGIFSCVAITHTVGWLVNESSMESVPFETGIKALITFLLSFQQDMEGKKEV